MERAKLVSAVILLLGLASWVLALGGLGSLNWIKCSSGAAAVLDAGSSVADVLGAMGAAIAAGAGDAAAGAGAASVAVCSRTWSWEWFVMFFQLVVMLTAAVSTFLPVLGHFFTLSTVIMMSSLNLDLSLYVWPTFDVAPLFSAHTGAIKSMYMSGSALAAGWVLLIIFNLAWLIAVVPAKLGAGCCGGKKDDGAPITGAVTGEEQVTVAVRN